MKKALRSLTVPRRAVCAVRRSARHPGEIPGGIGDIPVANVVGAADPAGTFPEVTRNIVRGVNPAGQSG